MNKEEIKKEIERLQKLLNKSEGKYDWLKERVEYWYVDSINDDEMIYNNNNFINDSFDKWNILTNNIFKTEEEAIEYKDFIVAVDEAKHEFNREEWENNEINKWGIEYSCTNDMIITFCAWTFRRPNCTYFKTREEAQDFLNKYEKQIKKYWFGLEE